MAAIKYSALLQSASGKLNGSVAKGCSMGLVVQSLSNKRLCLTRACSTQRNRMAIARQSWQSLTESERQSWYCVSSNGLSGYALFIQCKLNLLLAIGSALTVPRLNLAANYRAITVVTVTPSTPLFRVTLSGAVQTGDRGIFYISKAVSPGKNIDLKSLPYIVAHNSTSGASLNLQVPYIAKFGQVPQSGQKVFVKFVAINLTSGLMSVPSFFTYIVP